MTPKGRTTGAIVLAAGRSRRFRGSQPKVLHPLAGRPILVHVLETLRQVHRGARLGSVCVVVPPGGTVERALGGTKLPFPVSFAVQKDAGGTGAATAIGLRKLGPADDVLVLAGDMPLVRPESLVGMVRALRADDAAAVVLSATTDRRLPYGRVVRSGAGIQRIVEAKDATDAELAIRELNLSTYAFRRDALAAALPKLRTNNAQGERYLTDVVGELASSDERVTGANGDVEEALGTNTRADFAYVSSVVRGRIIDELMDAGVTVIDPDTTYVDAGVRVGPDTVLRPNTSLEGGTSIGSGCAIGPFVRLVDTAVADGAEVTFAVAVGSRIGPGAEVGPFASLRTGTVLRRGAKAGTFVETKAADIGEDAKVPHLSYMGDVRIGPRTNVGAGSITGNYNPFELAPDGSTKHRTTIGADAYIGSDTTFIAPVRLGDGAQTGAGSVVTRNVKAGELVFGVPARRAGDAKRRVRKKNAARTRKTSGAKETTGAKRAAKRPLKPTNKRKGNRG
jgi:bifunctional UDP-N-acetylglucosamine pyrophosphorylase/glucosamine-1-phosphate N-acetyltransferase